MVGKSTISLATIAPIITGRAAITIPATKTIVINLAPAMVTVPITMTTLIPELTMAAPVMALAIKTARKKLTFELTTCPQVGSGQA
jgi:hypothetical protein